MEYQQLEYKLRYLHILATVLEQLNSEDVMLRKQIINKMKELIK